MAALDKPAELYGAGEGQEWRRKAAIAVNWLLGPLTRRVVALEADAATKDDFPFKRLAAPPASPTVGRAYYDTVTNKARVYDGTAWNDLF